jgi:DNA-binding GntR family transcriptional regulator
VWDEHEAIARAVAAGDGESAARLMEAHGGRAAENLARELHGVLSAQPRPAPR